MESATQSQITVCSLEGPEEMHIGLELQRRIWSYSETDVVPDRLFIVARESGGQVLAAFEQDKPIGFALAFVGMRQSSVYLHSHMVGVLPEYQNRGVGRLLKLAQRSHALDRGIELIEWTFDPLQLKNAHFNLARLGAIARRYIPNCYGRTSSPLHAGIPTDRLVAEWWIASDRVDSLLRGKPLSSQTPSERICIPSSIRALCDCNSSTAEKIQKDVRKQFEMQISNGIAAVGFELDQHQGSDVFEPYEN